MTRSLWCRLRMSLFDCASAACVGLRLARKLEETILGLSPSPNFSISVLFEYMSRGRRPAPLNRLCPMLTPVRRGFLCIGRLPSCRRLQSTSICVQVQATAVPNNALREQPGSRQRAERPGSLQFATAPRPRSLHRTEYFWHSFLVSRLGLRI